ncbi:MAG: TRAP transporter small permease [Pseudolabrys sp.]
MGDDSGTARSLSALVARVIDAFGLTGVAALLIPIVLTCTDIVWRRAIGGAFIDTFDITKLCLVTVAAWTIPYGFVHGCHVTVDLIVERLPGRVQDVADFVISLAGAVLFMFLGGLAWTSAALHYGYHDTTQNLQIPVVYYWAIFIVGLALTAIACLWRAGMSWRRFMDRAGGEP